MSIIRNLSIRNYKSVRQLDIACERINVFLGKPNAGKSNILEGISLLGALFHTDTGRFMGNTVRYQTISNLFSNYITKSPISVEINGYQVELSLNVKTLEYEFEAKTNTERSASNFPKFKMKFDANGLGVSGALGSMKPGLIKKYDFKQLEQGNDTDGYLIPPFGKNFYAVIRNNESLKTVIKEFATEYGFKFLMDVENKEIAFVQIEDDVFLKYQTHLLPDTFQRYIFHLAAILSNEKSVLLFEEPETHSYGPYVYQLAQEILEDEGENQYFLTTHNPYLLTPLLQEGKQDLAVFITWFEDYQTKVRRLEQDEIASILDHGYDIFMNLDNFIHADAS